MLDCFHRRPRGAALLLPLLLSIIACAQEEGADTEAPGPEFAVRLVEAAREQVGKTVSYNGAYVALSYPGGDVPMESGVCTDRNIDHRRVPNLRRFFERQNAEVKPLSRDPKTFLPGDLVTCIVPPHLPHIMIVSDKSSASDPDRRLVIHNIGGGAQEEDRLFEFELTGHYRWHPAKD